MTRAKNWRTARQPAGIEDLTDVMLRPARMAANRSMLPQTVWPSRFYGKDFQGTDCLLISAAFIWQRYELEEQGIAAGAEPLLTVLPRNYFGGPIPDPGPQGRLTPECAGGDHYLCARRAGCDPALDHDGYCSCGHHGSAR